MRSLLRLAGLLVTLASLAGCVAPRVPPANTGTFPAQRPAQTAAPVPSMTPAAPSAGFIPPQIMRGRGLEAVSGAHATALVNLFGTPALDVAEGDVRKLQFRGTNCVLDVFLFPLKPGAPPVATWMEARRPDNGRDIDRASCISALRR
ncbi:hypothetical protein [Altererythrobacter sp. MF3-039]|uniref:hypothetical protein n=1 Tax=Altererythrobacter sp. MF3-039 TaxID=3252901 RepID=UPI00390C4A99